MFLPKLDHAQRKQAACKLDPASSLPNVTRVAWLLPEGMCAEVPKAGRGGITNCDLSPTHSHRDPTISLCTMRNKQPRRGSQDAWLGPEKTPMQWLFIID